MIVKIKTKLMQAHELLLNNFNHCKNICNDLYKNFKKKLRKNIQGRYILCLKKTKNIKRRTFKFIQKFLTILKSIYAIICVFLKIIVFVVKNILFKIKSSLLGYKLAIFQEFKYKNLFLKLIGTVILFLIGVYLIKTGIAINNSKSNLPYIWAGVILGFSFTSVFEIISKINSRKENLNIVYMSLVDQFQTLQIIYETIMVSFPYNDTPLFQEGSSIIYVSPINIEGSKYWMDEKKGMRFVKYFQDLANENKLFGEFNQQQTKIFIELIEKDINTIEILKSEAFTLKEYIYPSYLDLLNQTLGQIISLISYNHRYNQWNTPDVIQSGIIMINFIIFKSIYSILALQKLKTDYNEYISHIANPPKIDMSLNLSKIIKLNNKIYTK